MLTRTAFIERFLTGTETGAAADPTPLRALREAIDAPLIAGSGLTAENASEFGEADGAIVGTSLKRNGRVDPSRVEALVRAFRAQGEGARG